MKAPGTSDNENILPLTIVIQLDVAARSTGWNCMVQHVCLVLYLVQVDLHVIA